MAASVAPARRSPPGIYRLGRALRWVSVIVMIVLIVFAGTVAYSAFEVAHSSVQSRTLSAQFVSNGTIEITGSFTLSNPGYYPIEGLSLTARISNGSGVFLGTLGVGPSTVAPGATGTFPFGLRLPISTSSPASSLLTQDQYLEVDAWGNATYAYLFPVSVFLTENRSWGAPFANFLVMLGTPTGGPGGVSVPVTISFSNHASVPDTGTLSFLIVSSSMENCGGGSFALNTPPGSFYDETQTVSLAPGCSPSGGELLSTYSSAEGTTALPPERLP